MFLLKIEKADGSRKRIELEPSSHGAGVESFFAFDIDYDVRGAELQIDGNHKYNFCQVGEGFDLLADKVWGEIKGGRVRIGVTQPKRLIHHAALENYSTKDFSLCD